MSEPELAELLAAVDGLRSLLESVNERLAALESRQNELERAYRQDVDAETLVVLAAAVTSFLGKPVRIRSARRVAPAENTPAWTSFGRAAVQASHHVQRRG